MSLTIFLCGDVMLGRGIDQVLPFPNVPQLHESIARDARDYVELAVAQNGPIPRPMDFRYVWGDALADLDRVRPDFRIINLETTITSSSRFLPSKEIHYRMHPDNASCLAAAGIDCAVLANNHALDFGEQGLLETLVTLARVGIKTAGAGRNMLDASEPAILSCGGHRVLVYAGAHASSGVSVVWSATDAGAGLNFLPALSETSVAIIGKRIARRKQPGDIVVFSIHWGGNWGYKVEEDHRSFAHRLIDQAGVDVVHGHSSHHPRAVEHYRGKAILYGCGDFIDDYEGISGNEKFRPELRLMYYLRMNEDGTLLDLEMVPMRMMRFRLQYASSDEVQWLGRLLQEESKKLCTQVDFGCRNTLHVVNENR